MLFFLTYFLSYWGWARYFLYFVFFHSMEQSVSQATSVNHAAELDQILASYKVNMTLIV